MHSGRDFLQTLATGAALALPIGCRSSGLRSQGFAALREPSALEACLRATSVDYPEPFFRGIDRLPDGTESDHDGYQCQHGHQRH